MAFWVVLFVVIGVAGLGTLAVLTLRLWRQVRQLGRDVAAASARLASAGLASAGLASAGDELQRATPHRH